MSRVDVIIPCYRYGAFLEGCVRSILEQEGVDIRILIMDDCSPDNTPEVASRLQREDSRVEYRRHEKNIGHIATYNEGLAWVTGDYVLLISADDLLTPGSMKRATDLMNQHPEVGFAFGRDIVFESDQTPVAMPVQPSPPKFSILDYETFLEKCCKLGHTPIQAPCVLVRSSVHRKAGEYRAELPHTADTEIWLRFAAESATGILDADQAFRRVHRSSMSFLYSSPRRILEQKKAFDTHFDWCGARLRDRSRFEKLLAGSLADKALWGASIAIDRGETAEANEFFSLALEIKPEVRFSRRWVGLHVKRLMGRRLWSLAEHIRKPLKAGVGSGSATVKHGE